MIKREMENGGELLGYRWMGVMWVNSVSVSSIDGYVLTKVLFVQV